MKKLGKKDMPKNNTVEAYVDGCYCVCSCGGQKPYSTSRGKANSSVPTYTDP